MWQHRNVLSILTFCDLLIWIMTAFTWPHGYLHDSMSLTLFSCLNFSENQNIDKEKKRKKRNFWDLILSLIHLHVFIPHLDGGEKVVVSS